MQHTKESELIEKTPGLKIDFSFVISVSVHGPGQRPLYPEPKVSILSKA
jgi:hypothetical protein